jgi:integrase
VSVRRHGDQWLARISVTVGTQKVRKSRLCATRQLALQAERELATACRAAAEQAQQPDEAPATIRDLCEWYVLDLEARGKSSDTLVRAATTARAIETVTPELLRRPVALVTDRDLYDFRQARLRQGVKPATVNRDLTNLRAMFKQARPDYRFPRGLFAPADDTRVRWLQRDQETLVFSALLPTIVPIAKLAQLTLMRLSEVRLLRREDVHLEQGVILLPQAKAGARQVILNAEAVKLLRTALESHDDELVFPSPQGGPYSASHVGRSWRRAARRAGLKDFHFHDLRHHGAVMAAQKFPDRVLMALGGWKTPRMVGRYAAITDTTLRAAAEAVSGGDAT